jgi:uncharacterized protein
VEQDGTDIPTAECWDLLRSVPIGRVALSIHALPAIVPVQFSVDGNQLAICLGYHTIPDASVNNAVVAFAADAIDPTTRTGWTVHVQGNTIIPTPRGAPTDCGEPNPGPIMHLVPWTIVGHRIRLCPFTSRVGSS